MMFFRKCPVPELLEEPQENVEAGAEGKRLSRHTIRRLTAAFALAAMLVASVGTQVALASDTSGSGTASMIDMDMADQLIKLIKAANVLFSIFPINMFMMGALILMGLRVFHGAKKTATK